MCNRCEIQRNFETTISAYKRQALDPHVKRERFREEWFESELKDMIQKSNRRNE